MASAKVIEVIGDQGHRTIRKIRCRIIEGSEEGKILVRNARGPVREDDVVHIKETEMER
ncbi:30S ribosomal protein S28e [Nanohaloarchaea archaeon]|jgi:small subunit ribosomal protein S28e|nr:MAG: SSU ribosomal protein S28E [Candidatus Nanosalina sp. J07AB43]MBY6293767.1 30S ribosomal protein S28e [Nanohaloarchaea archaeon H01]NMI77044.1 30S ribosomal protein S28e [Candidatus Nanohaloarchaea archaeon]NMJ76798.1 30S ribosomal protein S28e [Candidatus Nanohaloarchaea archaeon]